MAHSAISSSVRSLDAFPRTTKLFVGGLSWDTSDESFTAHFQGYGDLVDAVVMKTTDQKSRGFGFVTFRDTETVEHVLSHVHTIDHRQVELKMAIPKDMMGGLGASHRKTKSMVDPHTTTSSAPAKMGKSRSISEVTTLPPRLLRPSPGGVSTSRLSIDPSPAPSVSGLSRDMTPTTQPPSSTPSSPYAEEDGYYPIDELDAGGASSSVTSSRVGTPAGSPTAKSASQKSTSSSSVSSSHHHSHHHSSSHHHHRTGSDLKSRCTPTVTPQQVALSGRRSSSTGSGKPSPLLTLVSRGATPSPRHLHTNTTNQGQGVPSPRNVFQFPSTTKQSSPRVAQQPSSSSSSSSVTGQPSPLKSGSGGSARSSRSFFTSSEGQPGLASSPSSVSTVTTTTTTTTARPPRHHHAQQPAQAAPAQAQAQAQGLAQAQAAHPHKAPIQSQWHQPPSIVSSSHSHQQPPQAQTLTQPSQQQPSEESYEDVTSTPTTTTLIHTDEEDNGGGSSGDNGDDEPQTATGGDAGDEEESSLGDSGNYSQPGGVVTFRPSLPISGTGTAIYDINGNIILPCGGGGVSATGLPLPVHADKTTDTEELIRKRPFKVFVGGLPATNVAELTEYFSTFGPVKHVSIMTDKISGKPRGFGFISFVHEDDARRAINHTGHTLRGKSIDCKMATPKPVHPSSPPHAPTVLMSSYYPLPSTSLSGGGTGPAMPPSLSLSAMSSSSLSGAAAAYNASIYGMGGTNPSFATAGNLPPFTMGTFLSSTNSLGSSPTFSATSSPSLMGGLLNSSVLSSSTLTPLVGPSSSVLAPTSPGTSPLFYSLTASSSASSLSAMAAQVDYHNLNNNTSQHHLQQQQHQQQHQQQQQHYYTTQHVTASQQQSTQQQATQQQTTTTPPSYYLQPLSAGGTMSTLTPASTGCAPSSTFPFYVYNWPMKIPGQDQLGTVQILVPATAQSTWTPTSSQPPSPSLSAASPSPPLHSRSIYSSSSPSSSPYSPPMSTLSLPAYASSSYSQQPQQPQPQQQQQLGGGGGGGSSSSTLMTSALPSSGTGSSLP